jgi:hypothetical protein
VVTEENVALLIAEVPGRIAKYSLNPAAMFITREEMWSLARLFPYTIILTALTRCGNTMKQHPRLTREEMLSTVKRFLSRTLEESHVRGKYRDFKGFDTQHTPVPPAPKPVPVVPKPEPKPVNVDALRLAFQDDCTNSGDWTLTEEDVNFFLDQNHSPKELFQAFKDIGRFDSDPDSQQRCFDALRDALDQMAWEAETAKIG